MSVADATWTWACQEPGCSFRITTEPAAGAPACPGHGVDRVGRVCEICGTEIAGRRADAETCGGACRAERSRRRRARQEGPEAHRGAQAQRRTPPRKRTPERGIRVYLLPDELAALDRGLAKLGWARKVKDRLPWALRRRAELQRRTALKVRAACRRISARANPRAS